MKIETDEAAEGKIQLSHAVESAMDFAVEREQQRDGALRHGVRRVGRHAHNGEAERAGGGHVHVVVAGAAQRKELHPERGEDFQARAVSRIVDENAHGPRPLAAGAVSAQSRNS